MALQEEYRVSLEDFCGPLDLLLFLVRRAEVDIQAISIARIADQYLDHLRRLSEVDIDMAGDFLVMAATLMEIKSRVLAPGLPAEGEDQAESPEAPLALDRPDPGGELIRQLLAYQRLR
jgi:segregation and condensation protein A